MSPGPVVRRTDGYTQVGQATLGRLARDERFDAPTRVMFLAWAYVRRNGHAMFGRGRLAALLGLDARKGGHAGQAVARAVARGDLLPGSYVGCVIVPDGVGARAAVPELCPHAERHQATAKAAALRDQNVTPG